MKTLMAILLLFTLTGCAPMSEQYWSDKYAEMTPEEIDAAKNNGATVTDIWIGAQTASRLVCINGDCVVVQIY